MSPPIGTLDGLIDRLETLKASGAKGTDEVRVWYDGGTGPIESCWSCATIDIVNGAVYIEAVEPYAK